jgi:hypothetical protein
VAEGDEPPWPMISSTCCGRLERDAERLEGLGGDAFALVDQPEQNVLGADVVVVEQASLFLGQHHHAAGSICESFKH